MARRLTHGTALLGLLLASAAAAQGHGPAYGLSTPTLGRGGWSLDVAAMGRVVGDEWAAMSRVMASYGVTADLQVSASLPMPLRVPLGTSPVRAMMRMPMTPDVEFLLGWRFHRLGTGVGSRFESTLWVGFDYPTDAVRAGVRTSPGLVGGLVTGYASRSVYAWLGGLYRRYMGPTGAAADRIGDLAMYSLVMGYRPPPFQHDYPKPDWRVFLEAVGEYTSRNVIGGVEQPDTGGHRVFVGATLLGLYGDWGISGGPVFPVFQRLNVGQANDRVRLIVNTTWWF